MTRAAMFCGWRGRAFVFRADGFSVRLTGPRSAIGRQLRALLPAYRRVAAERGNEPLCGLIDAAIAEVERDFPAVAA